MRRRKSLAVVELISKGSPRKMSAGPGSVYHISPNVKKVADLKDNQMGVKRLLSEVTVDASETGAGVLLDPRFATLLAAHVDSAGKICMEETVQKTEERLRAEHLAFTTSKDWDDVTALSDAKTVRVLVDMFLKSHLAKILLQELKGSVNRVYTENSIPGLVKDVVAETKHVLLLKSPLDTHNPKLLLIEKAVDNNLSSPSGQGFLQIMLAYLNANQVIHQGLTKEELGSIKKDIGDGKSFHLKEEGRQWLTYMVAELMKPM